MRQKTFYLAGEEIKFHLQNHDFNLLLLHNYFEFFLFSIQCATFFHQNRLLSEMIIEVVVILVKIAYYNYIYFT